ncbi:hypothetical protein RhiJN_09486 [Ceratobasidium sp. AG-Ba]|nr:hypothetical protein RhiJN_09486 [Ceratobasidium sp. AG-Ba]QRW10273.1 hypothetical protein RhiLY_09272 [Ceratobasidium sp. AG-Ba]
MPNSPHPVLHDIRILLFLTFREETECKRGLNSRHGLNASESVRKDGVIADLLHEIQTLEAETSVEALPDMSISGTASNAPEPPPDEEMLAWIEVTGRLHPRI